MISHALSHHAQLRTQQRGIQAQHLRFLLAHADRIQPCGDGCERLSFSRRALTDLARRAVPTAFLERVLRLTAVVANDGTVVTAYRMPARS